jgi:hypothetical protein
MIGEGGVVVVVGCGCDSSAVVREGRRFPARYLCILVGRRGVVVGGRGQSGVVKEVHGAGRSQKTAGTIATVRTGNR